MNLNLKIKIYNKNQKQQTRKSAAFFISPVVLISRC